ncbi:MAG: chromosome segregation protein [Nocardioidaceae bacterium]|nr:chromosome segregation protein [Nocardioidaceae bacterium]
MYLKSLTLRGFKSFASSTTLRLEPGITCVVGPNGSGKSNVVDALAWVMGEQGVKSLRGGKMEDVVFAGTAARPPLGRAEVILTIDNADGRLPIDYSEVTISRTMFRGGGSEYAINGTACRLLDVSELLSDSGIGREMHVVVGQGQLEAILHATPEERRGFIEEAAGVLKHRKRKEKALRKLDATEANLTRLGDLLGEIRRQLKPLGRQAEVARRASTVQMEVRDASARLLADDVVTMRAAQQRELADEQALRARRTQAEEALVAARGQESVLEESVRRDAPLLTAAQETWFGLTGVRERLLSTARVAAERVRHGEESQPGETAGRDPDELMAEGEELRAREREIAQHLDDVRRSLEEALARRRNAESAHLDEDRRIAGLLRAVADRREGLARLSGQVNALRSRSAAADDEIARLTAARAAAVDRAARAEHDFTSLETRIAGLDAGERGLDAEHEGAVALLRDLDDRLAKVRSAHQDAERERAALDARAQALEVGLRRKDGAAALLAAADRVFGLAGSVASLVSVRPGYEAAVAAALGTAADAVAVTGIEAAVGAIEHLKAADLGRADLVLGSTDPDGSPWPALPPPAVYAIDVVDAPESLRPALRRLLHKTAVVDGLPAARSLVAELPDAVAVTTDGDVLGGYFAAGGSPSRLSLIEVQAALDQARESLERARASSERLQFELATLAHERTETQARADVALAKLHESDASMAAVAEELGQLGSLARNAKAEAVRLADAIAAAEEARDTDIAGLADLERRLEAAGSDSTDEPDTSRRADLAERARLARQAELDARLALRTAEERERALSGQADALIQAAATERDRREQLLVRRERRRREAEAAAAVAAAVTKVLTRLERSLFEAGRRRTEIQAAKLEHEALLTRTRARVRAQEGELAALTDTVHREEMVRAEQRMLMAQLADRVSEELGLDLETLVCDYGPESQSETPFVRAEQQRRLRSAERALAELGRINPLALEEFSALEQRHRFLTEQLEDLRRTRGDLLGIVKEVDERVERVFTEAFSDVAREFETVFGRLFPGGEGLLVASDPSDMLVTGVDVEARPAGKKVKRLSLLSGGERSLVAVAFLIALFKARPSPFYILDEVEAALDDTNLGRLLEIYDELREQSQLVVITHQKRTMECADALYGVSMRGDGVSTVISQRLRERVAG